MTGLVAAVSGYFPENCLASRCRKHGCSVGLKGLPAKRLIVDLDKQGSPLGRGDKRCDYLFFAEDGNGEGRVVLMELKKGGFSASDAVRQLQAGANAAETLVPASATVAFCPVIASGSVPKAERTAMRAPRNRVRFRGRDEPLRRIPCGGQLATALSP